MGLSESSLVAFLSGCGSTLVHLELPGRFTYSLLQAIARYCPRLEGLCLTGTFASSPHAYAQLQGFFHACPFLREVCIAHAPLNDAQLLDLTTHCPLLECLGLSLGDEGVTAAGVQAALQQLPRLREVLVPWHAEAVAASPALRNTLDAWLRAGQGRVHRAAGTMPVLPFWRPWVNLV
jgi:hypothetical protein